MISLDLDIERCLVFRIQAPEFIFPVETRQRSWNEKWFDRVGTSYMIGMVSGGVWGLHEGVFSPERQSLTGRMRANAILNGLTRRGPFMANTLAVLSKNINIGKANNLLFVFSPSL